MVGSPSTLKSDGRRVEARTEGLRASTGLPSTIASDVLWPRDAEHRFRHPSTDIELFCDNREAVT